jgi:L-amino acid N-acyltransferase YncA
MIRAADPERDAAACAAIYAPYVEETAISFELEPPSAAEFAERIAATVESYPWIVLEGDENVEGYAYASRHNSRAAYRWTVDVAVYVDRSRHRRGGGRRLYEALFELLREQGYRVACAGVTLPNAASVGLHEALGFEPVGVYPRVGWKAGVWHDVGWWTLRLLPDADDPPSEPRPPRGS